MNKLEDLIKKHSFIYKIDDQYYYIGQWLFKPCTNIMVIDYYAKYKEALKNEDDEQLYYWFRKVRACSDLDMDETKDNINKKILEFIDQLSNSQKSSLQNQLDEFVNTFHKYYEMGKYL